MPFFLVGWSIGDAVDSWLRASSDPNKSPLRENTLLSRFPSSTLTLANNPRHAIWKRSGKTAPATMTESNPVSPFESSTGIARLWPQTSGHRFRLQHTLTRSKLQCRSIQCCTLAQPSPDFPGAPELPNPTPDPREQGTPPDPHHGLGTDHGQP